MRTLVLPNGNFITLNRQQNEALDKIDKFLADEEEFLFVLSGYAGTGKSTIISEVLDNLPSGKHVAVTAPTHKAKKVIMDTTDRHGTTIQALLGLQPNVDLDTFDINNPVFAVRRAPELDKYHLIVIDEASMLNIDLFDMLMREAVLKKVKLIFMCDEAQLPPVGEDISMVVTSDLVNYRYQLTQVERQSEGNPVMKIYDSIRSNLSSSVDAFLSKTVINEKTGEGIVFYPDLKSFGNSVVENFKSEEFKEDANYCKILCWTNARVKFWNQAIRRSIILSLPEEEQIGKKILMGGELVMAYQSYKGGITNSAEYTVRTISPGTATIRYGDRGALTVDVTGYKVSLDDVDGTEETGLLNTFIVEHTQDNLVKFLTAFNYFLDEAKFNRKWPAYYNFKSKYLLLQDITKGGKLILKKDLDYSYAITIHKSQGSTYNKIYMDMPDVNKNRDYVERNKLKYVGLSRISSSAHVLAT